MRKILFITLITSFISLESQARDYVCDLIGMDTEEMLIGRDLGNCKAGDLVQVFSEYPTIAMATMLAICEDKTIQVFNYDSDIIYGAKGLLHASCRLMPVKDWRETISFKTKE